MVKNLYRWEKFEKKMLPTTKILSSQFVILRIFLYLCSIYDKKQ